MSIEVKKLELLDIPWPEFLVADESWQTTAIAEGELLVLKGYRASATMETPVVTAST